MNKKDKVKEIKVNYYKKQLENINKSLEGFEIAKEWFAFEDMQSKIQHLEQEKQKILKELE